MNSFDNYPDRLITKWQEIADLLAGLLHIPAALIMKAENEHMEVFLSSKSENNPYHVGDKEKWYGLYCETVIKSQNKLSIPNAHKDADWDKNPDIKLGMIAYLGFPINFPDKQPFGTLCVLDNKERIFSAQEEKLLVQFKNVIELDLALIRSFEEKTDELSDAIKEQMHEQKLTEKAVRESHRLLKSTFDSMLDAVFIIDFKTTAIMDCNAAATKIFEYRREEMLGRTTEFLHVTMDTLGEFRKLLSAGITEKGYLFIPEFNMKRKDGKVFTTEHSVVPLEDEQGAQIGWLSVVRDITEQKKAEDALRTNEARYAFIANHTSDVIWTLNLATGKYTYVSPSVQRLRGYTPEEVMNQTMAETLTPESLQKTTALIQERLASIKPGDTSSNTSIILADQPCKDGSVVSTEAAGTLVFDEKGTPVEIIGVTRDITERKKAEELLQAAMANLETLFMVSPLAITVMDTDGNIQLWNKAAEQIFGWTAQEVIGKPNPIVPAEMQNEYTSWSFQILGGKTLTNQESVRVRKDGALLNVSISSASILDGKGTPVGRMAIFIDITERKKMEASMLNVQKLESLGVLAGGIAHDFNNLLGGIYGYIDLAGESAKDEKLSLYLSKAMNTIERARGLTQQLLTFAKGGEPVKKIGKLFPFVQETAKFALSGSSVSCVFEVPRDLWNCDYDRNQIGQVIDNIVINAKQAMPDGGTIAVAAANVGIAHNEHPPLADGDYVKISIKDSGIGMPREILPRIFDPFYTTKITGHGLGLASCYSIIKRHGGCIDVESQPGKGSTFHVYLPAIVDSVSSSSEVSSSMHRGTGTFLVMDDEDVIRDTIREMLRHFGYAVVCKQNGKEALDFALAEIDAKREIAGMIFDLTIPGGMGGKEIIGEIKRMCPGTPVYVTSGYAEDPIMANPIEYGFTASIRKPFRKAELSEMLNIYLNKKK